MFQTDQRRNSVPILSSQTGRKLFIIFIDSFSLDELTSYVQDQTIVLEKPDNENAVSSIFIFLTDTSEITGSNGK